MLKWDEIEDDTERCLREVLNWLLRILYSFQFQTAVWSLVIWEKFQAEMNRQNSANYLKSLYDKVLPGFADCRRTTDCQILSSFEHNSLENKKFVQHSKKFCFARDSSKISTRFFKCYFIMSSTWSSVLEVTRKLLWTVSKTRKKNLLTKLIRCSTSRWTIPSFNDFISTTFIIPAGEKVAEISNFLHIKVAVMHRCNTETFPSRLLWQASNRAEKFSGATLAFMQNYRIKH